MSTFFKLFINNFNIMQKINYYTKELKENEKMQEIINKKLKCH